MDVAPDPQHLLVLEDQVHVHSRLWRALVARIALRGVGVNVVRPVVAVPHAQRLPDPGPDHPRCIDTGALIDFYWRGRNRCWRKRAFDFHEDIAKGAVVADEIDLVHEPLALIRGGAHGIHAHADDAVARLRTGELHPPLDSTA